MSDPTTPTRDRVEDLVRRTLAVRAEDMAPGDPAGALPDLDRVGPIAPRRLGRSRRSVLLAAAVVVVAAATAGVALVARDGDGEAGRLTTVAEQPPSGGAQVPAITAPRALVGALHVERNVAVTTLLGLEGAIALPVSGTTQARSDTDAVLATFEAFVATSAAGSAYQSGLDGLDGLDGLRRDIDSYTGPGSLNDLDIAQDVSDRYAGLIAGVLDDQQAYALTIDDPVLRTGAVAYGEGLRLGEQTTQLVQASLLAVVVPGSESVAEAARLHAEVQWTLDTLVAETAGTPFAGATTTLVDEVEQTGLIEAAGQAIDGAGDVTALLGAVDLQQGQGWPAFLDSVEETLVAES